MPVRHARVGDGADVAAILAEALAAKYRPALGRRAGRALEAWIEFELREPDHGYRVLERDARIVAAAHLGVAGSPATGFPARLLAREIGWPTTIRALAVLSLLAHGPLARDEAYIGEFAVAHAARRQGVGRELMQALEREARERKRHRMTLWVVEDNTAAVALYSGMGFSVARRQRLWLSRLLFGSSAALFMQRTLTA
jgi:ribosomal protein S18 acetylase RimI-like enzyme